MDGEADVLALAAVGVLCVALVLIGAYLYGASGEQAEGSVSGQFVGGLAASFTWVGVVFLIAVLVIAGVLVYVWQSG